MITPARLKTLLTYDAETGLFTWNEDRFSGRAYNVVMAREGDVAGTITPWGYVHIGVDGGGYRAHRLAFFYMTGKWPPHEIDHINGNTLDNSWNNLRPATHTENARNSRTKLSALGVKGVRKHGNQFTARISVNRERIYLGLFPTLEEADEAYKQAAQEFHGEFVRST